MAVMPGCSVNMVQGSQRIATAVSPCELVLSLPWIPEPLPRTNKIHSWRSESLAQVVGVQEFDASLRSVFGNHAPFPAPAAGWGIECGRSASR